MKRCILGKTASFHAFHWKKRRSKNGVVLNGTMCLLLPLDAQRTGEEEAFVPCFLLSLSLSQYPKKHPTCPNPNPWPTTRRKNRGDKPLRVAQWPPGHPLPLCHDCTGVVALSSPFPPYKYQGREMKGGGEEKRRRKEKQSRRV